MFMPELNCTPAEMNRRMNTRQSPVANKLLYPIFQAARKNEDVVIFPTLNTKKQIANWNNLLELQFVAAVDGVDGGYKMTEFGYNYCLNFFPVAIDPTAIVTDVELQQQYSHIPNILSMNGSAAEGYTVRFKSGVSVYRPDATSTYKVGWPQSKPNDSMDDAIVHARDMQNAFEMIRAFTAQS